jgi:hypothetical protein
VAYFAVIGVALVITLVALIFILGSRATAQAKSESAERKDR